MSNSYDGRFAGDFMLAKLVMIDNLTQVSMILGEIIVHKTLITVAVAVLLVFSGEVFSQPSGSFERPDDWQVGTFIGFLSSETLMETTTSDGEPITAKSGTGTVVGLRVGMDREFLGIEGTLMTAFTDLNIDADPAADVSGGDADLYLASINLLWYPSGNDLDDGRFRPFFSIGPGLGFYDSDLDDVDGELLYDINVGTGFKLFTGDEGNPVIRLDWRWHIMRDFDKDFDQMYRQELSLGFGFRF